MSRKTLQRFKDWTGFFAYTDPEGEYHRGKTLWDWLQLLIIPAVLAGFALWFNRSENIRQETYARNEAERQAAILLDQQQEEALQSYLTDMEYLLLEKKLRTSAIDSEVGEVARERTLTILRGLALSAKGRL